MSDETSARWACKNCGYFNDAETVDKCARCNAPAALDPHIPDPAPADNLEKTPVADVKAIAAASGIDGADTMKKAEAIDAIRAVQVPGDPAIAAAPPVSPPEGFTQ